MSRGMRDRSPAPREKTGPTETTAMPHYTRRLVPRFPTPFPTPQRHPGRIDLLDVSTHRRKAEAVCWL